MKELEQILVLWSQLEAHGESAVLATVVKTSGSSYRLPGARLLLSRTGQRAGSVSGGCLEDDLIKKAWWLTENGPVVRRYDTTPEGEIAAEYGTGCNGIIYVALERVEPGRAQTLEMIRRVHETREAATILHVIPGGEDSEVFAETLTPPLRLLIFGAGEDAIPIVSMANFLGWEAWVLDGRAHYARRERFQAAARVMVRTPGDTSQPLPIDAWTAALLMSHSYTQDLNMLKELAGAPLRYLGLLGPRKRAVQMLQESGLETELETASFHAPMGLDLGADGAEQVALAVAAEIQATLNGRGGSSLRHRKGSIHAADAAAEDAWVQSIVCA
jgi:xanthine/CO dehydrogenase XdhC/CoxF family maturation factor